MARKEEKTNAMRMLDRAKICYHVHRYDCEEFLSGTEVAELLNQPNEKVYKTIVVQGNSRNYYVFVIRVDQQLDLKQCALLAKEKSVNMVYKMDLEKITGYIAGGCSPIGMKKQFKTWIDESCMMQKTICFSGGKRGCQIEMDTQDFLKFTQSVCAPFSK